MTGMSSPDVDVSTPAVVLKFDPNLLHHGGLGAIRSLGRLGVPVYGVHEAPSAPAAASRYLRGRWLWQPDPADVARTTAGLLALAERIGRPAVLVTTDDAGAIFLAEYGDPLREAFLFPAPARQLPRQVAGKLSLGAVCTDHGMATPAVRQVTSLPDCHDFATRHGYPVIAKLVTPWRAAGTGLRSTTVLDGPADLTETWQACARRNVAVMLQEFVPSRPGGDWFFHGYCDADSACRPAFTGMKVRSYPTRAGLTSLGRARANDELLATVTRLLAALSYRGIVDLDLRYDTRDGRYKLLDFNPRLGAQFRLFRDTAGVDVVLAAYLDLTGQPVPGGVQVNGRGFLVENYDPLAAFGLLRRRELDLAGWLASLHGVDEMAWFARDDLRPFGLMCLRMGVRAVTRRLRRPSGSRTDSGPPRYLPARTTRVSPRGAAEPRDAPRTSRGVTAPAEPSADHSTTPTTGGGASRAHRSRRRHHYERHR